MKRLIVGITGLCMCSGVFAAAPAAALREYANSVQAAPVQGDFGASVTPQKGEFQGERVGIQTGGNSNDECATNELLACNSAVLVDLSLATENLSDPIFLCQNGADTAGFGTVWYRFVAASPEAVVSTCNDQAGSPNDTLLQVFDGTCAALGTTLACADDNCGATTGFLSTILLTGLTINATYLIDLAAWDAGSVGVQELALDCNLAGGCCQGAGVCNNQTPSACVDLGGLWLGEDVACNLAFCVDPPTCPGGAINERIDDPSCGQPAPDPGNSGCNITGGAFTFLAGDGCNNSVTGDASSDARQSAAGRDTDWMFLVPNETTEYTACVTAQFFPQVQFWRLDPGIDPCASSSPQNAAVGNPGAAVCATQCLLGLNPYAIRVTIVDAAGNAQRMGVGCLDYCMTVTCDECVSGACCLPDNTCDDGTFAAGPYIGETVAQVNCEAQGGVYQGDGVTCAQVGACTAACCAFNGSCSLTSRASCLNSGGSWSEGLVCADVMPCAVCAGEDPNDFDGLEGNRESCVTLGADSVNDGCTTGATFQRFTQVICGQTMCAYGAFDGAFRDLDWYQLLVASVTEVNFKIENNLAGQLIFRVRYYPNQQPGGAGDPCLTTGALELLPAATGVLAAGQTTIFPMVLVPARYTLLAAYDFNTPGLPVSPCPSNYRMTIQCAAQPCTVTCTDTENEATCGDPTQTNLGCSATTPPGPMTALTLGAPMCGNGRLVRRDTPPPVTLLRDLDWYSFTNPSVGDVSLRLETAFNALFILQPLGGPGGCSDPSTFGFIIPQCCTGDDCKTPGQGPGITITVENLAAGNYAVLVAPNFSSYNPLFIGAGNVGAQENCPTPYRLLVSGADPCAGIVCGDSNLDGAVTVGDIGFFVAAVATGFGTEAPPTGWSGLVPGVQSMQQFICANDTNGDNGVTVGDIGLFVAVVTGAGSCLTP